MSLIFLEYNGDAKEVKETLLRWHGQKIKKKFNYRCMSLMECFGEACDHRCFKGKWKLCTTKNIDAYVFVLFSGVL